MPLNACCSFVKDIRHKTEIINNAHFTELRETLNTDALLTEIEIVHSMAVLELLSAITDDKRFEMAYNTVREGAAWTCIRGPRPWWKINKGTPL